MRSLNQKQLDAIQDFSRKLSNIVTRQDISQIQSFFERLFEQAAPASSTTADLPAPSQATVGRLFWDVDEEVLKVDTGVGYTEVLSGTPPGDDLGSHVATQALDMDGFDIDNVGQLSVLGISGNIADDSPAVAAFGTLTITTNSFNGGEVILAGDASVAEGTDWNQGATADDTAISIRDAINLNATNVTATASGNVVTVTADTAGPDGNTLSLDYVPGKIGLPNITPNPDGNLAGGVDGSIGFTINIPELSSAGTKLFQIEEDGVEALSINNDSDMLINTDKMDRIVGRSISSPGTGNLTLAADGSLSLISNVDDAFDSSSKINIIFNSGPTIECSADTGVGVDNHAQLAVSDSHDFRFLSGGAEVAAFDFNTRGALADDDVLFRWQNNDTGVLAVRGSGDLKFLGTNSLISSRQTISGSSPVNADGSKFVGADTSSDSAALVLLDAIKEEGREIIIKDESGNASINNITISTESTTLIDGSASLTMSTDYEVVRLYCDGSNWFIW